ncbi:hypothetical protein OG21DRAFT_1512475 [Imleria badia]|nr:hypothetical protein OG21DRAFT_1512475 [Imleria badia]
MARLTLLHAYSPLHMHSTETTDALFTLKRGRDRWQSSTIINEFLTTNFRFVVFAGLVALLVARSDPFQSFW